MADPIRYWTSPCALGQLLLAAGERGVTHLRFGDSADALARAYRTTFPEAALAAEDDPLRAWCACVVERLARWGGRGAPPELPLDLRAGTPFQRRVWEHLRTIPAGETRHYGDVARAIGEPRAVRAVASACARNPVAWLVPCHRVLPKFGGLGGYRWGAGRKRTLLARERPEAAAAPVSVVTTW